MRLGDLRNVFSGTTSTYFTLKNGVRVYPLSVAMTANVTVTTAPAGSLGFTSHATGRGIVFYSDGSKWQNANSGGGSSVSLETPTGAVNGTNDDFVFTAPPIVVFRNGVNETRLGSIATNTFTFDTPPETGDDIEGLV